MREPDPTLLLARARYMFQPMSDNPYLALPPDEPEAEEAIPMTEIVSTTCVPFDWLAGRVGGACL